MSSDGNYPDIPYGSDRYGEDDHTKPCTFGGCGGTMHFKPRLREADAPHTLEWPWHATWVCQVESRPHRGRHPCRGEGVGGPLQAALT